MALGNKFQGFDIGVDDDVIQSSDTAELHHASDRVAATPTYSDDLDVGDYSAVGAISSSWFESPL
jgi:hypothetical protein